MLTNKIQSINQYTLLKQSNYIPLKKKKNFESNFTNQMK